MFRKDLLARIDLEPFHLAAVRGRPEGIEPNLQNELTRYARPQASVAKTRSQFVAIATCNDNVVTLKAGWSTPRTPKARRGTFFPTGMGCVLAEVYNKVNRAVLASGKPTMMDTMS